MKRVRHLLEYASLNAAIAVSGLLSFDQRRRFFGWFFSRVVAHLPRARSRVVRNLCYAMPDLRDDEVAILSRDVMEQFGYTFAELFSPNDFISLVRHEPLKGAGVACFLRAHEEKKPIFLVTGHIGNYDAIRANLSQHGFRIGALYREMNNRFFNQQYVRSISSFGEPLFARGAAGLKDLIRFLRSGGIVGVVLDQSMRDGETLSFFGKPALTSTKIADLALRYDAVVFPAYGLRRPDGGFDIIIEEPVAASDARTMTQQLNDSLERRVREHPSQWLWTHRRWKGVGGQAVRTTE